MSMLAAVDGTVDIAVSAVFALDFASAPAPDPAANAWLLVLARSLMTRP